MNLEQLTQAMGPAYETIHRKDKPDPFAKKGVSTGVLRNTLKDPVMIPYFSEERDSNNDLLVSANVFLVRCGPSDEIAPWGGGTLTPYTFKYMTVLPGQEVLIALPDWLIEGGGAYCYKLWLYRNDAKFLEFVQVEKPQPIEASHSEIFVYQNVHPATMPSSNR